MNFEKEFANFTREEILNKVRLMMVQRQGNEAFLEDRYYIPWQDLAAYAIVDIWIGKMHGTMSPEKAQLERLGISKEDLFDAAMKNQEPLLLKIEDIIAEDIIAEDISRKMNISVEDVLMFMGSEPPTYVLTNSRMSEGASVVLDEALLREAGKKIKGDYYICPSSIHEMILVPTDIPASYLQEVLISINNGMVPDDEKLADTLYRYDRKLEQVETVAISRQDHPLQL